MSSSRQDSLHHKKLARLMFSRNARRQKKTTEPNIVQDEATQCLPRSSNLCRQMISFLKKCSWKQLKQWNVCVHKIKLSILKNKTIQQFSSVTLKFCSLPEKLGRHTKFKTFFVSTKFPLFPLERGQNSLMRDGPTSFCELGHWVGLLLFV